MNGLQRLWNKSNKRLMNAKLFYTKAVEEFFPRTALEGPQDAAGP